MGRWSQYDDDEHRLPEGMRRVGYDADTQIYTYQDEDGLYWEGPAGARYGQLRRVGSGYDSDDDHTIVQPVRNDSRIPEEWRYLAPFFLMIGLFLLGVYTLLGGGTMLWGNGDKDHSAFPTTKAVCVDGQHVYQVKAGESCWSIADQRGMTVWQLKEMNEGLDCAKLKPEQTICVASLLES